MLLKYRLVCSAWFILSVAVCGQDWHQEMYMGNNDFWSHRIAIRVSNHSDRDALGDPVSLKVGTMKGELNMAGTRAEAVRLITVAGTQFKFRLTDPAGNVIRRGPIPTGSRLVIPADCPARSNRALYLYYDNPSAWAIADHFIPHREVLNGGFELTDGTVPRHWELDWKEKDRKVEWVSNEYHSGKKSLRIMVNAPGKSGYGASQGQIHVLSGLDYILEAWIKLEKVDGEAGFLVEMDRLMRAGRSSSVELHRFAAGNGTTGWKKVTFEFTASEGFNTAQLQTYLDGTGTIWIDDISLTLKDPYPFTATANAPQKKKLYVSGITESWNGDPAYPYRVPVNIANSSGEVLTGGSVLVDLSEARNRLHRYVDTDSPVKVMDGKEVIPHDILGNSLFFRCKLPASTQKTVYIYFAGREQGGETPRPSDYRELVSGKDNLLVNGSFENGGTGWKETGNRGLLEFTGESKLGSRSLRLSLEPDDINILTGLEQTVYVKPGSEYMLCSWVKCSELEKADMRIQAIFLDEKGHRLDKGADFYSTGDDERVFGEWKVESLVRRSEVIAPVKGDSNWEFIHGSITVPREAEKAVVRLVRDSRLRQGPSLTQDIKVKDSPGTVWFDGVYFSEIASEKALAINLEWLKARDLNELTAWPVNPVVKVFRDDLPPDEIPAARITVAGNETEPLQLAIRAPENYTDLRVEMDPPRNSGGEILEEIEVGILGYVPINVQSNYYRNRLPTWHLKFPATQPGSDGWPGYWPDPILPRNHFDLQADNTQPLWIEISVPGGTTPGDYHGNVWLVDDEQIISEIPFTVQVRGFDLPEVNNFAALYDLGFRSPGTFYEINKTRDEMFRDYWRYMAEHRICSDAIHPDPVMTIENGKISFDWTEHDKAAEYYFNVLKMPFTYTPRLFYLFGWELPPRENFGERAYPGEYPYEGADRSKLRPEFKKAYQSALKQYWEHMKEKGWADKMVLYISDEPFTAPVVEPQMKALCDMIHEAVPDIPIYVSTWYYRQEYDGYIDVWGVGNSGSGWGIPVPVSDLVLIRSRGGRIIWTTDGRFCLDTPYNGIERMLPHYAFKYGAESYEFWNLTAYSFNPYEFGWHRFRMVSSAPGRFYWVRWPNGDGYLAYPGKTIGYDGPVATIRLKQARDGVEDYEYLHLLQELIGEARSEGRVVSGAEIVLDEAKTLVQIPSAEGRFSTGFLPDPDAVQIHRDRVAEAIESLIGGEPFNDE